MCNALVSLTDSMDVLQRSDNRRQGFHDHSADRRLRVFIPMGLFIKAGALSRFGPRSATWQPTFRS
jgi:hypothetical protein